MKIVNKNTNYDSTDNNMHECVHTCACTHAHTYTRTRMYMHTCTHTHSYALTHTHIKKVITIKGRQHGREKFK